MPRAFLLAFIALLGCRAPLAGSSPRGRTPEIHGRYTEGFYAPGKPVPAARFAIGRRPAPSDDSRAGPCAVRAPEVRSDEHGRFRVPPTPLPTAAPDDELTLCVHLGTESPELWYPVQALTDSLLRRSSLALDCLAHGERGSPDCVVVSPRALRRPPVPR